MIGHAPRGSPQPTHWGGTIHVRRSPPRGAGHDYPSGRGAFHHDQALAQQLTAELREGGYHVIDCPGPWPPELRCIRCDKGYCPLTESADLMIYDPDLTALNDLGQPYNLAVDSARAHPEVPMLLAWAPTHVPDAGTLRTIRAQAPQVHSAAREPAARLRQIHDLLAAG